MCILAAEGERKMGNNGTDILSKFAEVVNNICGPVGPFLLRVLKPWLKKWSILFPMVIAAVLAVAVMYMSYKGFIFDGTITANEDGTIAGDKVVQIMAVTAVIMIASGCVSLKIISCKYQKQIEEKNAALEEKNAELKKSNAELVEKNASWDEKVAELEEKDMELQEKNEDIIKLNEKIGVLKQILVSQAPAQAGYYMLYKDAYDRFGTDLVISTCSLDVMLEADSGKNEKKHLRFEWTLDVLNNTSSPIKQANFIYSGEKNDRSFPKVTIDGTPVRAKIKRNHSGAEDDRFIGIPFQKPLSKNMSVKIKISYTLSTYEFNRNYDFIWLVPDALGFADTMQFRIRFFADDEVVKDSTIGVLRSYKLSGEYSIEDDEKIEFRELENGKQGFECEKKASDNTLKGHGYLLILINDRDSLPTYLQNI